MRHPPYASEGRRGARPRADGGDRRLALSTSQVADRLGVSLGTVRRWADRGYLASYRTPGGQRRFSPEDVDTFLVSLQRGSGSGE